MTNNTNEFFMSGQALLSRGSTISNNKTAVFDYPFMFKQKMVRHRRRSGVRKIMECFKRCLNNKAFPHLLKWKDERKRIFSILYKHKKSPDWSPNHLALFKELDSLSITKLEKYKKQKDSDQAGKRRCKANLRKLCEDGLLELIREKMKDKCTKKVYYKFTDAQSDQTNLQPENDWIDAPFINDYALNNLFSDNSYEALQTTSENYEAENINLSAISNTSAGNDKYGEESGAINMENCFSSVSQTNDLNDAYFKNDVFFCKDYYDDGSGNDLLSGPEENVAFTSSSNDSSNNMDLMPRLEESSDINDLLGIIDDQVSETTNNDILWSEGCTPNINILQEMDLNERTNTL